MQAARPSSWKGASRSGCAPRDPVLYFVERLRDEAHRFAVGSHRQKRKKDIREAGLWPIPGIGPTRNAPCCGTSVLSRRSSGLPSPIWSMCPELMWKPPGRSMISFTNDDAPLHRAQLYALEMRLLIHSGGLLHRHPPPNALAAWLI